MSRDSGFGVIFITWRIALVISREDARNGSEPGCPSPGGDLETADWVIVCRAPVDSNYSAKISGRSAAVKVDFSEIV